MCGIAGIVYTDSDRPVDPARLQTMSDTLAHRGPDGDGIWTTLGVGLAHRRLKVIDLSEAAKQPMLNYSGTVAITFNGEIYNYRTLRRELERKGHVFRSSSDTEVLLTLYEEYGPECLDKLVGMFAFAIWDQRKRLLFVARDRLGQKPLVYAHNKEFFAFASEPKALLSVPGIPSEPDWDALQLYFCLQYIPAPWTAFRSIQKLPPAHYLIWHAGDLEIFPYWQLHYQPKDTRSVKTLTDEVRVQVEQATESQLVSDVPLGAFLSGGLDSSIVVAAMSSASRRPRTFSIGFPEASYDERPYASEVAERFQTQHQEFVVRPNAVEILPKLVWHYNEPFADASAIPTWYLAKMTKSEVTVALNGDGGDELFGGYSRYPVFKRAAQAEWIPWPIRKACSLALSAASANASSSSFLFRLNRFVKSTLFSREERYLNWMGHFSAANLPAILSSDVAKKMRPDLPLSWMEDRFASLEVPSIAEVPLAVDLETYLPGDLLVKIDIATMAHGLEARSPFLDHRLVEFAASLPVGLKMNGWTGKQILRKAFAPLLPATAINRRKQGFEVPLAAWFRGDLKEYSRETLFSSKALNRGVFERDAVEQLWNEHQEGRLDHHKLIWNLLFFELWAETFLDHSGATSGRP